MRRTREKKKRLLFFSRDSSRLNNRFLIFRSLLKYRSKFKKEEERKGKSILPLHATLDNPIFMVAKIQNVRFDATTRRKIGKFLLLEKFEIERTIGIHQWGGRLDFKLSFFFFLITFKKISPSRNCSL